MDEQRKWEMQVEKRQMEEANRLIDLLEKEKSATKRKRLLKKINSLQGVD